MRANTGDVFHKLKKPCSTALPIFSRHHTHGNTSPRESMKHSVLPAEHTGASGLRGGSMPPFSHAEPPEKRYSASSGVCANDAASSPALMRSEQGSVLPS